MFKFPENLYTDVRIEHEFETQITYTLGKLDELKVRKYSGVFIRIFDGELWYYSSISDLENIQKEIDRLALLAKPNDKIYEHPIVKKFQVNKGTFLIHEKDDVEKVDKEDKLKLINKFFPIITSKESIKMWQAGYIDNKKVKEFYSSKGAEVKFDSQRAGLGVSLRFAEEGKTFSDNFQKGASNVFDLKNQEKKLEAFINKCEDFMRNSKPIEPGKCTVVLSPVAAGVFAHESFGHKSEADFMIGDDTMKREWAIGTKVGSDILSIVDSGRILGSGFVPFDDEGTKAEEIFLIKNGELTGRLHSATTATDLLEEVTGNARAMNFEFEPIVRMTTTYIMPGDKTKEQLIAEIADGIYIETIKHGSGMSTFTIAPSLAYRIKDGKITEPVKVSVISGNVFETLSEIDGLSNELELLSFVKGGCGKMEQWPLPVGFGGPYVRVKNINVQ